MGGLVFIVLGAVIGGATGGPFGLFVGICLAFLILSSLQD